MTNLALITPLQNFRYSQTLSIYLSCPHAFMTYLMIPRDLIPAMDSPRTPSHPSGRRKHIQNHAKRLNIATGQVAKTRETD